MSNNPITVKRVVICGDDLEVIFRDDLELLREFKRFNPRTNAVDHITLSNSLEETRKGNPEDHYLFVMLKKESGEYNTVKRCINHLSQWTTGTDKIMVIVEKENVDSEVLERAKAQVRYMDERPFLYTQYSPTSESHEYLKQIVKNAIRDMDDA